jgi:hypothetical protein
MEETNSLNSTAGLFIDSVNEKIQSLSDIQKEWFIDYLEKV